MIESLQANTDRAERRESVVDTAGMLWRNQPRERGAHLAEEAERKVGDYLRRRGVAGDGFSLRARHAAIHQGFCRTWPQA